MIKFPGAYVARIPLAPLKAAEREEKPNVDLLPFPEVL